MILIHVNAVAFILNESGTRDAVTLRHWARCSGGTLTSLLLPPLTHHALCVPILCVKSRSVVNNDLCIRRTHRVWCDCDKILESAVLCDVRRTYVSVSPLRRVVLVNAACCRRISCWLWLCWKMSVNQRLRCVFESFINDFAATHDFVEY